MKSDTRGAVRLGSPGLLRALARQHRFVGSDTRAGNVAASAVFIARRGDGPADRGTQRAREGRPRGVRALRMLVEWLYTTRLVTRTRVAHACESSGVKPVGGMKVNGGRRRKLHDRPVSRFYQRIRVRASTIGPERCVSLAGRGRSQGKPWWRLVVVLTCKSMISSQLRGESLIEPSSSWFPSKFPSG